MQSPSSAPLNDDGTAGHLAGGELSVHAPSGEVTAGGAAAFGPELSDDEIQGAIFDIDGPPFTPVESLLLTD